MLLANAQSVSVVPLVVHRPLSKPVLTFPGTQVSKPSSAGKVAVSSPPTNLDAVRRPHMCMYAQIPRFRVRNDDLVYGAYKHHPHTLRKANTALFSACHRTVGPGKRLIENVIAHANCLVWPLTSSDDNIPTQVPILGGELRSRLHRSSSYPTLTFPRAYWELRSHNGRMTLIGNLSHSANAVVVEHIGHPGIE